MVTQDIRIFYSHHSSKVQGGSCVKEPLNKPLFRIYLLLPILQIFLPTIACIVEYSDGHVF
jgi:hypothetical protein